MFKYHLSILLPGINTKWWERLYQSIFHSIGNYSFEIICVGPFDPPIIVKQILNFRFIKDFGTPTRAAQIASFFAEGEVLTWVSDDGIYLPLQLKNSLDQFYSILSEKQSYRHTLALKYAEGKDFSGKVPPEQFWQSKHHRFFKPVPVPKHYSIMPVGFVLRDYFQAIGGFDCHYEHLWFASHDLAIRLQNDNTIIELSKEQVLNFDWQHTSWEYYQVHCANNENDHPLFEKEYKSINNKKQINYFNWRDQPNIWKRRFRKEQ